VSWFPTNERRMPEEAPIKRVATTRLAALNASTKISRSDLNFIELPFFATEVTVCCVYGKLLVVVGLWICGLLSEIPDQLVVNSDALDTPL